MLNPEQIANGTREASDILGAVVENAALQIVLGAPTASDSCALLRGVGEQARISDRGDIAQLIDNAIKSASRAADPAVANNLVSDCITRVQHVLCNPITAPVNFGTAPTTPP